MQDIAQLDDSLLTPIQSEIEKFLSMWDVSKLFAKTPTPYLGQIKKDRSDVRSFGSYWNAGGVHVLLVLALYKKSHESEYWSRVPQFSARAESYHEELDKHAAEGDIREALENFRGRPNYHLVGPESPY